MSKSLRKQKEHDTYIDIEGISSMVKPKILKVLSDMGYHLLNMELKRGKVLTLEIEIFSKDKNISLKDCEKVSNVVSRVLDVEDPIPLRYNLVVSSPGANRVLKNTREYEMFAGRDVEVKVKNFSSYNLTKDTFTAKILGVDGDVVKFEFSDREVWIDLSDITYVKLHFDLGKYFGGV
ncbi:MAG: hypothetical protein RMJ37_04225 [Spirochaetia bacterium]|nr:hypothetical protein [Spirochaetota bacterium]MCX8096760.1 hypothetical protein [Spirochaetota bacterium]MDW8112534.1 hypothetical protein [Spirochaetia bacterium]